jgi:tetratricopeptide (TPR) repeat protein
MKKILIATACIFTLCLTSCASKQTPEAEQQTEAPQTELSENTEENNETENTDNSETSEEDAESEETDESDLSDISKNSEDYPEPEVIEEPEIITLEPEEEQPVSENEPAAEEVETEEPPLITEVETIASEENDFENTEDTNATDNTEVPNISEEDKTEPEVTGDSDSDDDGITAIGGGIDITDDDSSNEESTSEAQIITPSRSVTLKKFEYLDITYPGTGWIYMGLTDNSKDLAYFGRKLGTKDTKFSLQARAAGKKIVHFYRNDPLTGHYLDDYIEVIIQPENGSNKTHIEAPEYKLPVQKKNEPVKQVEESETENQEEVKETSTKQSSTDSKSQSQTAAASTANTTTASDSANTSATKTAATTDTATATTTATTTAASTTNPSTLLQEAQLLYNEKEYAAALAKLNQFFEYSTDNRDEALYLKGQILEAKSDIRDIKGSIDAYTSLTKNYPASKYWDSANKRIIYLKRFYLEVR